MNKDSHSDAVAERLACQQILAEDRSVFSVQRLLLPGDMSGRISAEGLLRLYFDYVERFTLGMIRVAESEEGVEFRLAGCGGALIRFSAPLHEKTGTAGKTVLRICGGLLVQPKECDRGQLEFKVETEGDDIRVTLQLSDYCPLLLGSNRPSLLRKWLYRLTQAYIHKVVTIRFLRTVYWQMTGRKLAGKAVMISFRKGENI